MVGSLQISALQEQLRASQNETELVAQQLKHCEFELAAAHRRPETESRATWTGYADTPSASGSDVDGPLMSAHETSATPGKVFPLSTSVDRVQCTVLPPKADSHAGGAQGA